MIFFYVKGLNNQCSFICSFFLPRLFTKIFSPVQNESKCLSTVLFVILKAFYQPNKTNFKCYEALKKVKHLNQKPSLTGQRLPEKLTWSEIRTRE